ncbi:hypothetical protein DHB64_04935 [Antarcticibacterium sp. W02-3]|nr:hypothetical protein [Antarcticibacterium sp. W02-3]
MDDQPHLLFSIKNFLLGALLLLVYFNGMAQDPFKFMLNEEKDQYIQISGSAQVWLRYTDMNPGSLVNGEERSSLADLSLRRFRLNFAGKFSQDLRINLLLGNNNINHYSYREFEVKVLEAFIDYRFSEHFAAGIGKQGWTGLSRYAAPSFSESLAHDISFHQIPLVVAYDDILRRWGIYARGKIDRIDYRFSLSRPSYPGSRNKIPLEGQATFANVRPNYQLSGYFKYQFFEHESQLSAWSPGTYLGRKKVLNIGAGFLHQPNTTWQLLGDEIQYNPFTSLAVDLFYEQPLPQNSAVTLYASYHHHDLGQNFIRSFGINNPAAAGLPNDFINGPGTSTPIVGTGDILFLQAGYLLPVNTQNTKQLQPFASFTYGVLEILDVPAINYNAGIHLYLAGQNSKISFAYENRPLFKQAAFENFVDDRKGMFLLQYQARF